MKKILLPLFLVILITLIAGCSTNKTSSDNKQNKEPNVNEVEQTIDETELENYKLVNKNDEKEVQDLINIVDNTIVNLEKISSYSYSQSVGEEESLTGGSIILDNQKNIKSSLIKDNNNEIVGYFNEQKFYTLTDVNKWREIEDMEYSDINDMNILFTSIKDILIQSKSNLETDIKDRELVELYTYEDNLYYNIVINNIETKTAFKYKIYKETNFISNVSATMDNEPLLSVDIFDVNKIDAIPNPMIH